MEVWKIVFHSILKIFHSIPFWHLPYSIPKFPYHSISYQALVVDSILLLLWLDFTPTVAASLKIRKRLILKKMLSLPAPFQHFRFRVRFPSNLFHQSASASSFRFYIPGFNSFILNTWWFFSMLHSTEQSDAICSRSTKASKLSISLTSH